MFDPRFGKTGFYTGSGHVNGTIITCQLCRKIGHGAKTCSILSYFGKGGYNGGNGGFARNSTGGNGNGNTITCQLCKQIGHGAKTCSVLSYFGKGGYNGGNGGFARNTGGNGNGNTITCQLCKQIGHGAKTCRSLSTFQQGNTLIGVPNQQQRNLLGDASAMIAAGYQGSIQVEKVSSLQSQSHLNITVPNCFPHTQSSCQSLVPKRQYDQLHDRFLNLTLEKDAIQLVNQELNDKLMEFQKIQKSVMVQLSAECQMARERIEKLEFEAKAMVSKKIETEKLVSELELKIDSLSESSRSSENKMQYLLLKVLALETKNKANAEKVQGDKWKKAYQMVSLRKVGETHVQHVDLMDKQVSQLHITLEEKEQVIQQYKEHEKNLEEQILENRTLLTAAETRIVEDKKKYDLMLESKQLELSRRLKDISQRNDQAISDIQKKYEVEKLEIVNIEKRNLGGETERECEKKLEKCSQGDLVVRLYMWVNGNLLLPLLSCKSGCNPQSRDLILQSVENFWLSRDLKVIALAGSPGSKIIRQVAQKTLNYSVEAVKEDIPDLSKEPSAIFIECHKQWDMLYLDNLDASVIVLKKLSDKWKEQSVKHASLDLLRETLKSFREKNEKALAKGDDLVYHSLFNDANKYCKLLMHLYIRIFVNLKLQCSRTVASLYLLMVLLFFWKLAHACIQTLCKHQVEAEYCSVADTMSELQWLMFLLYELHIDLATIPVLHYDNFSTLVLAENPVDHNILKHREVDVRFTRAQAKAGTIKVQFVRSKDQLADLFTNGLCSPQRTYLCDSLMLGPLHQSEGGC